MIAFVLVVLVGFESLIATFSQDVWNDCAEALSEMDTAEEEEEEKEALGCSPGEVRLDFYDDGLIDLVEEKKV